jgi:hypothetical protein
MFMNEQVSFSSRTGRKKGRSRGRSKEAQGLRWLLKLFSKELSVSNIMFYKL